MSCYFYTVMFFISAFAILLALFGLLSCEDEQCKPVTARCDKTVMEVCNGDGQWESILDCADYNEQCCEVDVNEYECKERC